MWLAKDEDREPLDKGLGAARLELTQDMLGEQTFTCKAILSENNPEYVIIQETVSVSVSKF